MAPAKQNYIALMTRDELSVFGEILAASNNPVGQRLGAKLKLYLSPYPANCCADCGAENPATLVVSSESVAMTEVMLENFQAIKTESRNVCLPCAEAAQKRVDARRIADGELPDPLAA